VIKNQEDKGQGEKQAHKLNSLPTGQGLGGCRSGERHVFRPVLNCHCGVYSSVAGSSTRGKQYKRKEGK